MIQRDDLVELIGVERLDHINAHLEHSKGSWGGSVQQFIHSAIDSYCRDLRPDYIGPGAAWLPDDWPWPPEPGNTEHAQYYDFTREER